MAWQRGSSKTSNNMQWCIQPSKAYGNVASRQNWLITTFAYCRSWVQYYAVFEDAPKLPGDQQLGISEKLELREWRKIADKRFKYRGSMKKNFRARHGSQIPNVQLNDLVLVRKDLLGTNSNLLGPFALSRCPASKAFWRPLDIEIVMPTQVCHNWQYFTLSSQEVWVSKCGNVGRPKKTRTEVWEEGKEVDVK